MDFAFDIGLHNNNMNSTDWMDSEVSTGTSIMAVEFDGGVVIGADSRTTTGAYIANRVSDKLTRVTDHIYCCRSGSAADTQAVSDAVAYRLDMLSMSLDEPVTVRTAANDFKQICYSYRESLSAGIIVGGWDRKLGGQVYSIPLGGMVSREPCCIGGSGSGFIYGFTDANYRKGMTQNECVEFVSKALAHAMWRDCSSGGIIRLGIITEKGIERRTLIGDDVPKYYKVE
ncbi:proteasome subunit beta type-6-like [Uloborus diversus]|uniref:proteasome subunit beta type-6-like n=1 Tax=Uloborus diversus TaxID=327109 RepID=UPI002409F932|nr:proteasome subunit beta type-6-like [Uloborus diversus]